MYLLLAVQVVEKQISIPELGAIWDSMVENLKVNMLFFFTAAFFSPLNFKSKITKNKATAYIPVKIDRPWPQV